MEKEKAPNTTSSESTKPIFDLPAFEANEYQQNEIYDIIDNLGSESKTSSPNIESIPNISQKKTDKELTLQTLDNKSNGISSTYNINEPITNNFDYNEYKTSKPIIETSSTYREFKPSLETTSTIETKSVTSSTPTFEKYNPSFDLDTVGIEAPTSDNLSLKTKEPITTITTFETNPEFDYTSNVGGDFDVTTEIKPMAAAPDVTSKNINPKYTSKTYQAKKPVIKTGFDFTNLGTSSYYDMGEKYNEYKTTTLKKSKQNISLPTDYTTIKTVSKPFNASTTTTTLLQSTPSFVANEIYKDYQTIQNIKDVKTTTFPKKEAVNSITTIPTETFTKTEYISGPKISSYFKPVTITTYTKPNKIESPPIPVTLPEPIVLSLLETGTTFGDYKISKKEKNVQSVYSPTYSQRIIKSSSPKSLVPQPEISMVPQISIVPRPNLIKKIKKVEPIIIKIPKIQKVYIPKIKKVYIPSKKKIYITNPSTSFNQQISYIPKPSLSIIQNSSIVSMKPKITSVVSQSPIYNYIQKGIPVKSYAPVQASTFNLSFKSLIYP